MHDRIASGHPGRQKTISHFVCNYYRQKKKDTVLVGVARLIKMNIMLDENFYIFLPASGHMFIQILR